MQLVLDESLVLSAHLSVQAFLRFECVRQIRIPTVMLVDTLTEEEVRKEIQHKTNVLHEEDSDARVSGRSYIRPGRLDVVTHD